MSFKFTEGQQMYLDSPHTNEHLKNYMRQALPLMHSIKAKQRALRKKMSTAELIEETIESELEYIEILKDKRLPTKSTEKNIKFYSEILEKFTKLDK